ncbi:MAG TPA: hypothetical protein ENG33_11125 [Chloroflexi bacterium]|nr:hypothetical protein [Chloroflexota bacterium]
MPLREEDFDRKFVVVGEQDTVADALEKLKTQGGGDEWHIFIRRTPERFGVVEVTRLKEMLAHLGPNLFELTFAQLRPIAPDIPAVQQDAVGLGTAERWAHKSPGGALVVMRGEEVIGRFYIATKRGSEVFPGSSMGQLYGDYINTAPDARAQWRPAGIEPPTCPHCGHQGFYRYDAENNAYKCAKCGEIIS